MKLELYTCCKEICLNTFEGTRYIISIGQYNQNCKLDISINYLLNILVLYVPSPAKISFSSVTYLPIAR